MWKSTQGGINAVGCWLSVRLYSSLPKVKVVASATWGAIRTLEISKCYNVSALFPSEGLAVKHFPVHNRVDLDQSSSGPKQTESSDHHSRVLKTHPASLHYHRLLLPPAFTPAR